MLKNIRQSAPLFEDATTEATATPPASGSPTPTHIEVDGVKMSADDAAKEIKKAKEAAADTKTLFDPSASIEAREAAGRRNLARLGYTKDQIDAWVASNITGVGADDDQTPTQPQTKPNVESDAEISDLRKQVRKMRTESLNTAFNNSIEKVVLESGDLKTLFDAALRLRGADKVATVKQRITDSLKREALRRIQARVDRTGEEVATSWLIDEVRDAVKEVVEQHSAVIGDAATVGRSVETSTSTNPFANRKKAPAPVFNVKKSLGEVEQEAIAFLTDDLIEAAMNTPSGGGSKA